MNLKYVRKSWNKNKIQYKRKFVKIVISGVIYPVFGTYTSQIILNLVGSVQNKFEPQVQFL